MTTEELRVVLGGTRIRTTARTNASDDVLDTVEVRAPEATTERHGEPIPFGLAGIVWGVRHPTQAWRLFLPVVER